MAGADESGEDVNGRGEWLWTVQSPRYTYLMSEPSRGKGVMDKHFPNGLPGTVLVTDRLPLYFKLNTKGHQICLAHLLRNLKYLDELDTSQDWSKRMGRLLRDAIHQRKHKSWEQIDRKGLMERLKELLAESVEKLDEEFGKLQRSLRKLQDYVFTFLFNKDVPSDNNASEGAIRKAKIKMKVSQAFRSRAGAESFAVLHSVMDTAKKNGMPIFQAVRAVVEYQPIALPELRGIYGVLINRKRQKIPVISFFHLFFYPYLCIAFQKLSTGEMVEWSITAVLKTAVLRGTGGSNPSLSADKSA